MNLGASARPSDDASGRDRGLGTLATGIDAADADERVLIERLRSALVGPGFLLYAQPIAPLRAGAAGTHFEVLLRLVDEDGAILAPASFVPLAERYGLMADIDRWVVRNALAWWPRALARLAKPGCLAINLSAQTLADEEFPDDLLIDLAVSGVDPATLIFEVTETQAIADLARAARVLGALRRQGSRTALDDFGSGHCSFQYLERLPLDFLKTAGSFVLAMDDNPVDLTLVAAMNAIGHDLGLETVAECVETPAMLERVHALGMDFAQGYTIALPYPRERALPS